MDLKEAREEIGKIDAEMAGLFVRRMEAAREIAYYKKEHGLFIEDLEQEARVLESRGRLVEDESLRPFYLKFLQNTMDVSKEWQRSLI
ncbi:MAG: chorismate mutase [Lachnospiraceae bacterium]|nr:chorismate mutase [Lachnospiraceae bacterium]